MLGGDSMRSERLVAMGPVGCPPVAETSPAGLAVVFQTSIGGVQRLIGDALNLRHRLPRTWARVTAGQVHAWKARQLAHATAHLNPVHAGEVDRLLVGHLELVAWRRFEKMLDATVLHVDEASYQARARQAATHRDVWASQSSDGAPDTDRPRRLRRHHRVLRPGQPDRGGVGRRRRRRSGRRPPGQGDRHRRLPRPGFGSAAPPLRRPRHPPTPRRPPTRRGRGPDRSHRSDRSVDPATRATRGRPNPPRPAGEPSSTATTTNPAPTNPAPTDPAPTLPPTTTPEAGPVTVRRSTNPARISRIQSMRRTGTGSTGN